MKKESLLITEILFYQLLSAEAATRRGLIIAPEFKTPVTYKKKTNFSLFNQKNRSAI
jgi:hypothetical protein